MKVQVDGAAVDYEVLGPTTDAPVVLSHSLGSDRSMWEPQIADLRQGHTLVLVDTLGHGRSDSPPGPYTIAQLGRSILAVADQERIEEFHFCGVSMGGQVGLWLAINHPGRVRSLVAANTAARIGTVDGWEARVEAIRAKGMDGMAAEIVSRFLAAGFTERHPARWERVVRTFLETDPEGYVACCQAVAECDLTDEVGGIEAPVLVVGGSEDLSTPPDQVAALHTAIPASELEVIPGAAHLSNLDAPSEFGALLRRFLVG